MGLLKRGRAAQNAPAAPDLNALSDEEFWDVAAEDGKGGDAPAFGESAVVEVSPESLLSAEVAAEARFRVSAPEGYLESQVDAFCADVVDTLRYYESLVTAQHIENQTLLNANAQLRSLVEVFKVYGRPVADTAPDGSVFGASAPAGSAAPEAPAAAAVTTPGPIAAAAHFEQGPSLPPPVQDDASVRHAQALRQMAPVRLDGTAPVAAQAPVEGPVEVSEQVPVAAPVPPAGVTPSPVGNRLALRRPSRS